LARAFGVGHHGDLQFVDTKDVRLKSQTVRAWCAARKPDNVTAKDFMLEVLRHLRETAGDR